MLGIVVAHLCIWFIALGHISHAALIYISYDLYLNNTLRFEYECMHVSRFTMWVLIRRTRIKHLHSAC